MSRYFTPDKLGPLCPARCGYRIPKVLIAAGIHVHPTCVGRRMR